MAEKNIDKNEIVSTVNGSFIMYRNRPLVREENIICYGSMEDKYMLQMNIHCYCYSIPFLRIYYLYYLQDHHPTKTLYMPDI